MNTKFKQTEVGEIPENWQVKELSDCLSLIMDHRGMTPKKLGGDWSNSKTGYRALSAKSINSGRLKSEEDIPILPENLYKRWVKDEVQRGDILLTSEGPLGEYYYWDSDEKIVLSQRLFGLRGNENVFSKFLYYFISSPIFQIELKNRETGTTVTGIKQSELLKTNIIVPSLTEQQQIASILSSLDDKIELNRKMHKTLEEMAKALFKHWFVDFEFPNEEGKPYKSSGGAMVESELGMIPSGWRIGKLKDICKTISKGTTPRKSDIKGKKLVVPFIKVKDINDEGDIGNDLEYIPIEVHNNELNRSVLEQSDILFSIAGTIGRVALLDSRYDAANCNQALAFIRLSDKTRHLSFVHQWLKTNMVQLEIKAKVVQGVQANVSLTVLGSLSLALPSEEAMTKWNSTTNSLFQQIKSNKSGVHTLSRIRDSLLPKLMSGKIRVV